MLSHGRDNTKQKHNNMDALVPTMAELVEALALAMMQLAAIEEAHEAITQLTKEINVANKTITQLTKERDVATETMTRLTKTNTQLAKERDVIVEMTATVVSSNKMLQKCLAATKKTINDMNNNEAVLVPPPLEQQL
jgi:chromosome segregation ATPase